ncbi:HEAT repeat domain-containing protein [Microlunatus endophyticus]
MPSSGPTYYCWSCYGRNDHASGPCDHCGDEIEPPADADLTTRLVWGIRHPNPDVALMSVRRLPMVGDSSAIPALRAAVIDPPDPYVAAAALKSLLSLSSVAEEEELLRSSVSTGPPLVASIAREALKNM